MFSSGVERRSGGNSTLIIDEKTIEISTSGMKVVFGKTNSTNAHWKLIYSNVDKFPHLSIPGSDQKKVEKIIIRKIKEYLKENLLQMELLENC